MAFRSVASELPYEGHEVRIVGLFAEERRGYYELVLSVPVWMEAIHGPDRIIADVTDWDDIPPPPQIREIR